MAGYAINNRITDPEGLKAFDTDGYAFDASASTPDKWIFSRQQK